MRIVLDGLKQRRVGGSKLTPIGVGDAATRLQTRAANLRAARAAPHAEIVR